MPSDSANFLLLRESSSQLARALRIVPISASVTPVCVGAILGIVFEIQADYLGCKRAAIMDAC